MTFQKNITDFCHRGWGGYPRPFYYAKIYRISTIIVIWQKNPTKVKNYNFFFCSKWKIIMLDYPINTFSWNENLKYQKLSHVLLNIGQKLIKKYNGVIFCPIFNNKWPNFWYFEVFISAKCVYRIYLAYLLLIFSKKKLVIFRFLGFLGILQIS